MQQERQAAGKIKAGHKRTLRQFPCQKEAKELEYPAGLKWTRQRKLVYKILWEAKEPLNAAQIYHLAEKEAAGEEYALSTVYRILAAFEELALVENLQREDLDPVEEAVGIHELMARCDLTQEQAARKLGKSRSALANSLRLLNLPENVLELLKGGFITTGHAKVILSLPTAELQEQAAQMIADNDLNVRQAEALCKKLAKPPKAPAEPAPIDTLPVEVEESLKEVLGSEVNVAYHGGKGKLTVHFYSDEQLKAFANLLGKYQQ